MRCRQVADTVLSEGFCPAECNWLQLSADQMRVSCTADMGTLQGLLCLVLRAIYGALSGNGRNIHEISRDSCPFSGITRESVN